MRFAQYKMINELSGSLNEALRYMRDSENFALSSDCAMALSAIAEALQNETDAPKTKKLISSMLSDMEKLLNEQSSEVLNKLTEQSEKLSGLCKNELRYKLLVLFVAELSAKWDSMKSVYDAMMARGDVDVDVVLEPVFRAVEMPDGTVKSEVIYEDWLTPMGILHVPFTAYDISKVQPDITFISQPYESVTHPQFWPENIAKYSKLVYLPYYTALTVNPGSNAYESFLKMPIEKHAWKIVCQSEQMKAAYEETASRKGENVIVTGLPKWDYPMALDRDKTLCPPEWKDKIEGRKVLLVNTHYTTDFSFLEYGMGKSFNEIVGEFNGSEDVAIIWRPHPMAETVSKLYNSKSHEAYLNYVEQFEKSSNMIIDKSEFYDVAFACSDALISGRSSIISQYTLTGKPIMLYFFWWDDIESNKKADEENQMFDYSYFFPARTHEDTMDFVESIREGKSTDPKDRNELISKYFSLADGHVGERVADELIEIFKNESDAI